MTNILQAKGRPSDPYLTPRQAEALAAIEQYRQKTQCSPSLRDVAEILQGSVASAHQLVTRLKRKGCIRQTAGGARNLVLTPYGYVSLHGSASSSAEAAR